MHKQVTAFLALMLSTVLVLPGVMAYNVIELGEWVEIDPDGTYDLIQTMDEEMNSTFDDWYYKPDGRYIGPSTTESEARMTRLTHAGDLVTFTQEMTFSSNDIMSGVGDFWARTPVKNDGWTRAWVMLFCLEEDTNYFVNMMGELGFDNSTEAVILIRMYIDPSDTTVFDGNDYYTHDSRLYVRLLAPLKPDERYLFVQVCEYTTEERIGFYVTPTVIPDGRSAINVYDTIANENVETRISTLPLAWSFIMTEGFSDGVKGHKVDLVDGLSFEFYLHIEGSELPERQDNVSILIPFLANCELDWELDLYHNIPVSPPRHYYAWANDTKNYINVRTTEFINANPVSDYWNFLLTLESVSPPAGAEVIFFLYDDAELVPYYGSILGDDIYDDFMSYYPDNASTPLSSLRIYLGDSSESRKLGFSMVHYVDMVDQNGTYLESLAGSQITKGTPKQMTKGLLDYNIIGEGEGAWYESKVYRGIEGYLHIQDQTGEWMEENIPGIDYNPYKSSGEVEWVMNMYRENEAFREAANIVLSHPFEAIAVYTVNGTDGLLWLGGEYAQGEDPDWEDIYDYSTEEDGPLEWLKDFLEWVRTSWVKFRVWMENLVDSIAYYIDLSLAVANLCCVASIGIPGIFFLAGIYFAGDLFIKLVIAPRNTIHRIAGKFGDIVKSFILGRDAK